jgi:signal transduction histidine kinase
MLKKPAAALIALALAQAAFPLVAQQSRATRAEAEAMVRKGVEALQKMGREKTYAEITAPAKTFVDRDLYLVVYDLNGKVHAHGQNPKQVGKDLIDFKDSDGKPFVRERVELAKSKGKFWQDYKFTDPLTKTVMPKQMYCERHEEVIVCGGIYKG